MSPEDKNGTWYRKKPHSTPIFIKHKENSSDVKQVTSTITNEVRDALFHSKSFRKLNSKKRGSNPSLLPFDNQKVKIINGENVLKGGAKKSSLSTIFTETIEVAKNHGINLKADASNAALGNCLFDSVIDNINHRPNCFSEKLEDGVDHYRVLWVSELEEQYKSTPSYPGYKNNLITNKERGKWAAAWAQQMNSREYNVDQFNVSDLTPAGLGHCINRKFWYFLMIILNLLKYFQKIVLMKLDILN